MSFVLPEDYKPYLKVTSAPSKNNETRKLEKFYRGIEEETARKKSRQDTVKKNNKL